MTAKTMRAAPARLPMAGRLMIGAALLLALLAAGHAVLWRWMAGQIEDGFAAWAAVRRQQGWVVEHAPPVRGGWPFAATLRVPHLRLVGGAATVPGGVEWQSDALLLRLRPPRLDRLSVEMVGPQRLRLGEAVLPYAADRLEAVLPLESGVLPREAEIAAERLRIGTVDGPLEIRRATLTVETRTTATESEAAVTATLDAEGLDLPPRTAAQPALAAIGRRVESLAAEAVLTGPLPPGDAPALRAEAWREGGGTLELRGVSLRWGPVAGTASMTLTLDESLQPMGAGAVQLAGVGPALDALSQAGVVSGRAAESAKAVLLLLSRAPEGGGPPQVEVPVTLEDRSLAVARLPVARLPALAWPALPAPPESSDPDPSLPTR